MEKKVLLNSVEGESCSLNDRLWGSRRECQVGASGVRAGGDGQWVGFCLCSEEPEG